MFSYIMTLVPLESVPCSQNAIIRSEEFMIKSSHEAINVNLFSKSWTSDAYLFGDGTLVGASHRMRGANLSSLSLTFICSFVYSNNWGLLQSMTVIVFANNIHRGSQCHCYLILVWEQNRD